MSTIVIATKDPVYEKIISNIEEIRARGGRVLSIVTKGDSRIKEISDRVIEVPQTPNYLSPIINSIPLQLLAYHAAVQSKSVTVE